MPGIRLTRLAEVSHNELMKKGQALVVVLLVLGVLATIGLSVMSRSRTEVTESTVQEESARALEAAEVGLEKYLGGTAPAAGTLTNADSGGLAKYSLGPEINLGNASFYKVPFEMQDGDVATLDLTGFPNTAGVAICWGKAPLVETPALSVMLYYRISATGEIRVKGKGYDPLARGTGWFNVSPSGITDDCGTGIDYVYRNAIRFNDTSSPRHYNIAGEGGVPLFMRVRLVFNKATAYPVGFQSLGAANFPLQAGAVESMGTAGDTVQRIKAVVPDYDMPGIFDNAIFSGSSLVNRQDA